MDVIKILDLNPLYILCINIVLFLNINLSHFAYLNLKYKDKLPKLLTKFTNVFVFFNCFLFLLFNLIIVNVGNDSLLFINSFLTILFLLTFENINNRKYIKYLMFSMLISAILYNFSINIIFGIMHLIILLVMIVAANIFMFTINNLIGED